MPPLLNRFRRWLRITLDWLRDARSEPARHGAVVLSFGVVCLVFLPDMEPLLPIELVQLLLLLHGMALLLMCRTDLRLRGIVIGIGVGIYQAGKVGSDGLPSAYYLWGLICLALLLLRGSAATLRWLGSARLAQVRLIWLALALLLFGARQFVIAMDGINQLAHPLVLVTLWLFGSIRAATYRCLMSI